MKFEENEDCTLFLRRPAAGNRTREVAGARAAPYTRPLHCLRTYIYTGRFGVSCNIAYDT